MMFAGKIAGEFFKPIETPGSENQATPAAGQIGCQRPADAGTSPGDDCDHVLQASAHDFDCTFYIRFCGFLIFFICGATENT